MASGRLLQIRGRHVPIIARWIILGSAAAIGFRTTFTSIFTETHAGDPLAYLLLFPLWGLIIAIGIQTHQGTTLDIHDRQVDWIVAGGIGILLVMLATLLRPRLGATAPLVRLDLIALILFTMAGCVLLFGTRATGKYWQVWLFLVACWPLAYRLIGAALGGSTDAYGLLDIMLSTFAVAIWAVRPAKRVIVAALATLVIGLFLLAALRSVGSGIFGDLGTELLPAFAAPVVVVAIGHNLEVRAKTFVPPPPPKVAVKAPLLGLAVLLAASGIVGQFAAFAPSIQSSASFVEVSPAWVGKPTVLTGWTESQKISYRWVNGYFGAGSTWTRYEYKADTAIVPNVPIVVDVLSTTNPLSLSIYPAIECYSLSVPYLQPPNPVRLSDSVNAQLFYANAYAATSAVHAQWIMLTWTWKFQSSKSATTYQRVDIFTLDGAGSTSGIPLPSSPATNSSIRNTFSDILRGYSVNSSPLPSSTQLARLASFASEVAESQQLARSS